MSFDRDRHLIEDAVETTTVVRPEAPDTSKDNGPATWPGGLSNRVTRWFSDLRDSRSRDHVCRSSIDGLTGLELRSALATLGPVSVIVFVNLGLRTLNQTYGHRVGDIALRVVAGRLRDALAPCRGFRIGGGLFMFAIDQPVDAMGGADLARRIAEVAAEPIAEIPDPVDVCIGISLRSLAGDPSFVMAEADRALNEARTAGLPFGIASSEPIVLPAPREPDARRRAGVSLEGLALGDAFGEQFFVGDDARAAALIEARQLPDGLWRWTDDTALAIPIVRELQHKGFADASRVARRFAQVYARDPARGYGRGTHQVLGSIAAGVHWSKANRATFADGSRGNGAAMRSAPIGAYFAGRSSDVSRAARQSALPTHAHPDAIDGAVAVALAASYAATSCESHRPGALLEAVIDTLRRGVIRDAVIRALDLLEASPPQAAAILGSGQRVLAEDTVPFALWCADRHIDSFEEAMWATVSGLGDRDTTCAIVGGVVGLSSHTGLPATWLSHREDLPAIVRLPVDAREALPASIRGRESGDT